VKLFITGSRGFIGGSVGRYAAGAGHTVMGTGRSVDGGADWPGDYLAADPAAEKLAKLIHDFAPDVVLHAAGSASVGASLTEPLADLHAAAVTCANMFEGVRLSGVKPVVIIPSSASVYGNPQNLPVKEDTPVAPISPYGFHKAICEMLGREYAACFGLNVIACRFFSVFGERQRRLLVWELYQQLAGPEPVVWLDGTGSESRDFVHIDDAAEVMLQLAGHHATRSAPGSYLEVNIGSGIETSVQQIAHQLRTLVAPEKEIRSRGNTRPGDPLRWQADVARLHSLLPEWQASSLAAGLARCVAAWKREADSSTDGS
jgi:UDP-glucose 4-epimerase